MENMINEQVIEKTVETVAKVGGRKELVIGIGIVVLGTAGIGYAGYKIKKKIDQKKAGVVKAEKVEVVEDTEE